MLAEEEVREIRERVASASTGPWGTNHTGFAQWTVTRSQSDVVAATDCHSNAALIAASRTDIPRLLEERDELIGRIKEMENTD